MRTSCVAFLLAIGLVTGGAEARVDDPLFVAVSQCRPQQPPQGTCLTPRDPKFAALPDIAPNKPANLLIIPFEEITGIEDPKVKGESYFSGYWSYAWSKREHVATHHGKHSLPDDAIGLAINSKNGRSLHQLHMHMDCLAKSTRDALRELKRDSRTVDLQEGNERGQTSRQTYWIERKEALAGDNFFDLVAAKKGSGLMSEQTLVVAGAPGGGFYVLGRADNPATAAHGEGLLDHKCAVAEK